MNGFVYFILFIIISFILYKLIKNVTSRIRLVAKLASLKKLCGAKVTYLKFPLISLIRWQAKPEIMVEIRDTVYLIRTIGAGGASKSFHFASPRFTVTFTKFFMVLTPRSWRAMRGRAANISGMHIFIKVRTLPELQVPEELSRDPRKKIVPVLIFSPAPGSLTYVAEEKTSIKLAFTGDEFYGHKIFTASTFVAYADREAHKDIHYHFYS